MQNIKSEMQDIKADNRATRRTVIITGITLGIAVVLGVAGFNAMLLSNMISSFESGARISNAQIEVNRQVQETDKRLIAIDKRLEEIDRRLNPEK